MPAIERLFKKAAQGHILLILSEPCLAEITWVLESVYDVPRSAIASFLQTIISSPGISIENPQRITAAVALYGAHNIDFADAYLAAQAQAENISILSYDRDFEDLSVRREEPLTPF